MPTPCSSCDRTHGKCESCRKVDAVLTPERIADIQEAAEAEWLGAGGGSHQLFMTTFARAISREVVGVLAAEINNLRAGLQYYADQNHFGIADEEAWDTVSGEPQNFWCDEGGTAMVEDGSIAKAVLEGKITAADMANEEFTFTDATPAASGIGESGGEVA